MNSRPAALITGGSQGIGAATVQAFLTAGWDVATIALPGENIHRWRDRGVVTVEGDLTAPGARQAIRDAALDRFGRLDVLVNNAGVGLYGTPCNAPGSLLRRLLEVNLLAPMELTRLVLPSLRRQGGGTIVNLGSVAGHVSMPWAFGYCASKFSLHAFNDSLRRELRGEGIRVVKICPGIVATRFRENVLGGLAPGKLESLRPVVAPERIATAILAAAVSSKGPETVYVPRIGRLFSTIDHAFPAVMDWYLSRVGGHRPGSGEHTAELDLSALPSGGVDS